VPQECNKTLHRFLKKNSSVCTNLYEPVTFAVIPDRESQEPFLQWYSWAERCPRMHEGSTCITVAHMAHWNLVFSFSLNTTVSHSISKGRKLAIYATAVHTKPHQDYVERQLNMQLHMSLQEVKDPKFRSTSCQTLTCMVTMINLLTV